MSTEHDTVETHYPDEFIDIYKKNGRVLTRFPPEPNGYLHLGHIKAMEIDFGFAKANNGHCIMRFDDTNPTAEKTEFFDKIREDLKWLNYDPVIETYSSDYFKILYLYAIRLIQQDNAYVCELSSENISKYREEKKDSPFRNRPIDESIKLFEEMKLGLHPENSLTLRMKGDMTSHNPSLWDIVMYRIIKKPHPRTGNEWSIYPTYDYSHGIIDSIEGITHSFCTKEFEIRREQYYWFINKLNLREPYVYEFGRLNIENRTLSKRKIKELIELKVVNSWDDPRLLTVQGLKRKGFTPNALRAFCRNVGITKHDAVMNLELLEHIQRTELDLIAPRRMVVIEPQKLRIININDHDLIVCDCPDFPIKKSSTIRRCPLTEIVYIEKSSFRIIDSKDYYGLAPGKTIRLKYGPFLEYVSHDDICINVKIVSPEKPKKIKGVLNWVNSEAIPIIIRKFDNLEMNECNSLAEITLSSENIKPYDRFQFERHGYFCYIESTVNIPIFNLIVSLKSSFE